ncbi:MAG: hypothetical protein QME81_18465, partial [bacterium]|nr:hypothetical protein [bacterium]
MTVTLPRRAWERVRKIAICALAEYMYVRIDMTYLLFVIFVCITAFILDDFQVVNQIPGKQGRVIILLPRNICVVRENVTIA